MIIITIGMTCMILSFALMFLTRLFPVFQIIYLDFIAGFIMFIPFIIVMYFIINDDMYLWVERISKWKHRFAFMRRDNRVIPMTGRRIYASESFFDNQDIGLMEFLGKDCILNWGKKKIAWVLENLNYTPDPRYAGFTSMLYTLGFSCPQDVVDVMNGDDLELMAKVWINMQQWDQDHGVKKLVKDLREYKGENFSFEQRIKEENDKSIRELIDEKLGKVSYDKYDKGY